MKTVPQVREMGASGVMNEIERIAVEVAESILAGRGFGFRIPTRTSGNQKYVEELDRIVLGDKVRSIYQFLRIAGLITWLDMCSVITIFALGLCLRLFYG